MNNKEPSSIFDYEVIDSAGERVGAVHDVWADHQTGQPKFIGARTGALGATYVLPIAQAQLDHSRRVLQLPFHTEFMKHAPHLSSSAELTAEDERKLKHYYGPFISSEGGTSQSARGQSGAGSAAIGGAGASAAASQRVGMEHGRSSIEPSGAAEPVRDIPEGGVQLRKVVRKERIMVPVEVEREYIEQVPLGEAAASSGQAPNAEEIRSSEEYAAAASRRSGQPVDARAEADPRQDGEALDRRANDAEAQAKSETKSDADGGTTVRVERPR